jgi:hypothetical protein
MPHAFCKVPNLVVLEGSAAYEGLHKNSLQTRAAKLFLRVLIAVIAFILCAVLLLSKHLPNSEKPLTPLSYHAVPKLTMFLKLDNK